MYDRYQSRRKNTFLRRVIITAVLVAGGFFLVARYHHYLTFWRYDQNKLYARVEAALKISDAVKKREALGELAETFMRYKEERPADPEAFLVSGKVRYHHAMAMLPGTFSELLINDRAADIEKEPKAEFIRAIRDFRKARALDEGALDETSLFMLATSAYLSGYYAPAEIFTMIEKRGDPGKGMDVEFVRFYSVINILNGKEDYGLAFLSRHGMAGDSIRGLLFYATAERMAKKYTGAIMTYRKVLAMTPDDRIRELVHFNLGRIYYQQSLFREAIEQFSGALGLNEGSIPSRIWMGRCYLALGDREKARALWNEVLARDGSNAEAKQLLGTI